MAMVSPDAPLVGDTPVTVGGVVRFSTPVPVAEPFVVVMTISFAPRESDGTVQVSDVSLATETLVAAVPPILTDTDPALNPVPVMVTVDPDVALDGEMDE